ncbi:MAG TPA: hypothetical protein VGB49_09705, partial [Caulobacteraceae bacterium]
MRRSLLAALVLLAAAPAARAQDAAAPEPAVVLEARAFMDSYAADLRARNRAGLADRYHRDGVCFARYGRSQCVPHAEVA